MEIVDKGQELNLTIRQGATFGPVVCTLKDELGAPVDITGYIFRAQIRKTPFKRKDSGCAAVTAIVDAVNGQFSFEFAATDTAALDVGLTEDDAESQYVWDMEMEQPDGRVVPFTYGVVKVFREVTKDN